MAERLNIPLFPLHSVLFPGGPLQLRVFEPRYLDMVGHCLKTDSGFGVCLIREGKEVGEAALTYEVGTLGRISYWHRRNDGLLGVTIVGEQRFRINASEVQRDKLIRAEVELIAPEPPCPVPAEYGFLVDMLRHILEQLDQPYRKIPREYENAAWVGARLAELLPLHLEQKQRLLQLEDALQRLERLRGLLDQGAPVSE